MTRRVKFIVSKEGTIIKEYWHIFSDCDTMAELEQRAEEMAKGLKNIHKVTEIKLIIEQI